ncbi:MAG: OprO/OprP family phosphate-selective porin, partial [Acidobacteriales bacterium]|nr:OprO/OprP family phosphate-selective porin [Terriglobales bacterium]
THWRLGPQAYWYAGPFGLLAEYTVSSQELTAGAISQEIENSAWQVAISYVLTGEKASYRGVTPAKNFNPASGGWGAFEVAARYGELDIDNDAFPVFANPAVSATKARSAGVGLNWYLNRNVKAVVNYNWSGFDGPVAAPNIASKDEHAIFTRVQLNF